MRRTGRRWLAACCAAVLLVSPPAVSAAGKKAAKKKQAPKKVERLACMLGTDDRHARVAIELVNGRVQSVAYYSKQKPRTCSVHLQRNDAYSKWRDEGRFSLVTTENGDFLIENRPRDVHLIFRDVDRMAYCGMDVGRINGSLTAVRGRKACVLDSLMDAHDDQ